MERFNGKHKGFTMVELVIVLAIIMILAAIAIPKYNDYQCKAKQIEARQGLGSLAKFEETYHSLNDRYATSKDSIGFSMKGNKVYYDYTIIAADISTFSAKAEGFTPFFFGKNDSWTIDQTLILKQTANACN